MEKVYAGEVLKNGIRIPVGIHVGPDGLGIGNIRKTRYLWAEIKDLQVFGPSQIEKRVTATRLLAFGLLALAAKKADGESIVHVRTQNSGDESFYFLNKTEWEVRSIFSEFFNLESQNQDVATESGENEDSHVIEKLSDLIEMHKTGLLDQEEFEILKKNLIRGVSGNSGSFDTNDGKVEVLNEPQNWKEEGIVGVGISKWSGNYKELIEGVLNSHTLDLAASFPGLDEARPPHEFHWWIMTKSRFEKISKYLADYECNLQLYELDDIEAEVLLEFIAVDFPL